MEAIKRFAGVATFAAVAVICLAPASQAANKYRKLNFTGVSPESPTTGNEGLRITAGSDTCTVNFPAGITNNGDAAQEIIDDCNGGNFTITRVGNEVTICHATRTAKLRKVNIANKRSNSAHTLAALRSDPGIEIYQEPGPQDYPTTCAGDVGPCACGNQGGPGEGCMNSTGAGSLLYGEGIASLTEDSFDLVVTQTPNQPGIFFQGENSAGAGLPFGDGVRCCGGQILRLGTYLPAGNMTGLQGGNMLEGPGAPVSQHPGNAGLQPGETRCYQWWHRDPGPSNPCQQHYFNLSNSIEATWGA